MKRCRCCRQEWPLEFYTVCRPDGLRRSTCMACRKGCKRFRQRYYQRHHAEVIARTRAWKADLREQVRLARARAWEYNGAVGSSDKSNTIADGPRVSATTRGAGVIAFRGSSS